VLSDVAATSASDVWALGCIIFYMLVGRPPFRGSNEYQTFQKILKLNYTIPAAIDDVCRQLLESILVIESSLRPTIAMLKTVQFFEGLDWESLHITDPPKPDFSEPLIKDPVEEMENDFNYIKFSEDEDGYQESESDSGSVTPEANKGDGDEENQAA
jgi:3-phosphoinositide dependent protein kinase-1